MLSPGTRVCYVGPMLRLYGKVGTVEKTAAIGADEGYVVNFYDDRRRYILATSLKEEPTMNFKILATAAVNALVTPPRSDPKNDAAKRLGVFSLLASIGESGKKKAKADLVKLGVFAPGTYERGSVIIFDSPEYQVTAETKAPSSFLDVECLRAELKRRRLSEKAIADIISASMGEKAAATSLKVEPK